MATYKVIDVSDWQGKIDWVKVKKDGVVGAIIRYADGTTLDKRFIENMKGAISAGLHVGCYIFSRAKTTLEAEKEASRLYNASKNYHPDMPLYIDLEVKANAKVADAVAAAYLNKMKALGGWGGVYASLSWWNNYLKKTAKNYTASPFWIAQYYSKMEYKPASYMGMWQYTSSGSVKGISGRVDMNKCYVAYWDKKKKPVSGIPTVPSVRLIKTNAEVIEDTIRWYKWIAGNNEFHYGSGMAAHHNGCYFCKTQPKVKEAVGILDWKKTYCCNPFINAGFAHGGCVPAAMKLCQNGKSWSYEKGHGYDASSLFDNLGHPNIKLLKPGDVLCNDNHVAAYIGNGKIAEAAQDDDNKRGSEKWNNSIHITALTDTRYNGFKRVHRFNGSVDTKANICFGEIGDRVVTLQKFLKWRGYDLKIDGIFGNATLKAVKDFQKKNGLVVDGVVGSNTVDAMHWMAKKWVVSAVKWARTIASDNTWHYVKWSSSNALTHECPICHKHPLGSTHGWNCIGYTYAFWHHGGGIPCKCNCHVISNEVAEKMYNAKTDAEALKIAKKHTGLDELKIIRNKKGIPLGQLRAGDSCMSFIGDEYNHSWPYIGDGKTIDCTGSSGKIPNDDQIKERKAYTPKIAIRYLGK